MMCQLELQTGPLALQSVDDKKRNADQNVCKAHSCITLFYGCFNEIALVEDSLRKVHLAVMVRHSAVANVLFL